MPPTDGISDALVYSIIKKESGFDDNAIGDKHLTDHAYGCMQIRQPVCDDVNRVYGGSLRAQDMLKNRPLSIATFRKYMGIYATEKHLGRAVTDEDRARLWNGGPGGLRYPNPNPQTEAALAAYWAKVHSYMVDYLAVNS